MARCFPYSHLEVTHTAPAETNVVEQELGNMEIQVANIILCVFYIQDAPPGGRLEILQTPSHKL